jgi:hypothetical protein
MRYRLRSLLTVLAVGPPVLAGVWNWEEIVTGPRLAMPFAIALTVSLFTLAGFAMFMAIARLLNYMA